MNSVTQEIVELVGRPPSPIDAGAADAAEWGCVEQRLGLRLPPDFKQVLSVFGTCTWASFLHLLTPFTSNENLQLERGAPRALGAAHCVRRQYPEDIPFALYPESGGLFPWGITDNGDTLYWLTQGPSGRWPTVILQARDPESERHNLQMSTLILRFLRGELESRILLDPFEGVRPMAEHSWNRTGRRTRACS